MNAAETREAARLAKLAADKDNAAPETPAEPVLSDLDMLKALMAKFSKADIVKLTKEVVENKQTLLSVTMDCIVAAGDTLITDTVTKAVTRDGRAAGVLDEKDEASVTSVAQLIRHVQAYRAAVKRHDAKATETPEEGETSGDDKPGMTGDDIPEREPYYTTPAA